MPQGTAFFTAQPAAVSTSGTTSRQRRSAAAATADGLGAAGRGGGGPTGLKREAGATEEEIVGTLEEAVGSHGPAPVASATSAPKTSKDTALERALAGGRDDSGAGDNFGPAGFLYDSDSDSSDCEEEVKANHRRTKSTPSNSGMIQQPLTLPFPPVGGVDDCRGALYPATNDTSWQRQQKPALSPFVHTENQQALRAERDAWFLVQFPTRLPAVEQQAPPRAAGGGGDDEVTVIQEEFAAVATPPIQLEAFDNALANAVPGRLGRIKIYKSGKTVFVTERQDGAPGVRANIMFSMDAMAMSKYTFFSRRHPACVQIIMNVSEGLSCGFLQQAVAINLKSCEYVPLGPVERTVVITPDLTGSF